MDAGHHKVKTEAPSESQTPAKKIKLEDPQILKIRPGHSTILDMPKLESDAEMKSEELNTKEEEIKIESEDPRDKPSCSGLNHPPETPDKDKFNTVFQLELIIRRLKPRIWRRILVPGNANFKDLNLAIQEVFQWSNSHLHQFNSPNKITGKKDLIVMQSQLKTSNQFYDCPVDGKVKTETDTKLEEYFVEPKDSVHYEYDFGFPWEIDVKLEKILKRVTGEVYPRCTGGRRASPPEEDPGSDDDEEWKSAPFDPRSVFVAKQHPGK